MQEYESHYDELFEYLPGYKPQTIVEVGMNEGVGTLRLKKQYPEAQIFTIDEHVRAPDYTDDRDAAIRRLKDVATIIIDQSPFQFAWPFTYDLCAIDIGSDPHLNYLQLKYWEKWGNPHSILVLCVPRGDEKKRERKKVLIETLTQAHYSYETVFNWFVFKNLSQRN